MTPEVLQADGAREKRGGIQTEEVQMDKTLDCSGRGVYGDLGVDRPEEDDNEICQVAHRARVLFLQSGTRVRPL